MDIRATSHRSGNGSDQYTSTNLNIVVHASLTRCGSDLQHRSRSKRRGHIYGHFAMACSILVYFSRTLETSRTIAPAAASPTSSLSTLVIILSAKPQPYNDLIRQSSTIRVVRVVDIVFGILGTGISGVTIWQGRKYWVTWRGQDCTNIYTLLLSLTGLSEYADCLSRRRC